MIRFFVLITFIIFPLSSLAECNFIHADFITEINSPLSIKEIAITVPKSSKFSKNFFKIVTTKSRTIPPKLRKKFVASVSIEYEFGKCNYPAKIWQNGDLKDHIQFTKSGMPLRSLNVKLEKGNILNAVKFKLLLPETRGGHDEIFQTVIMRELGFITPETFEVQTRVNGISSLMLFQEDARKELLERNSRREGPIFEGDETILWGDKGRLYKYDDISLSRLINDKWFLKGKQSAEISISAYKRLQNAYLSRADNIMQYGLFIQPNLDLDYLFKNYHFTLIASNGFHGLVPHNRRFYYNSFLDEFEPIYYDGDVSFKELDNDFYLNKDVLGVFQLSFDRNYNYPFRELISEKNFQEKVFSEFSRRVTLNHKNSKSIAKDKFLIFIKNVDLIQNTIEGYDDFIDYKKNNSTNYEGLFSRISKHDFDHLAVIKTELSDDGVTIYRKDGQVTYETYEALAEIISEMSFLGRRAILTEEYKRNERFNNIDLTYFKDGYFISSYGTKISINEELGEIYIEQSQPQDWITFVNITLQDWDVFFKGKEENIYKNNQQRFNEHGMTGCLNFYNVSFDDVSLDIRDGFCEDSLNIVSSSGSIETIQVEEAYSDAIDLDFSRIHINSISIHRAKNDCIDVSGGIYKIRNVIANNCGDKGLSVGEKSNLSSEKITVNGANIGISSKDYSQVKVKETVLGDVKNCFEVIQKKQEFGGSFLELESSNCLDKVTIDGLSKVKMGNNEF